jgi:hypothetical protein
MRLAVRFRSLYCGNYSARVRLNINRLKQEMSMVKSTAVMRTGLRYVRLTEYKRVEAQCKVMFKVLDKIASRTDWDRNACGKAAAKALATVDGSGDANG